MQTNNDQPADFVSNKIYLLKRLFDVNYDEYKAKVIIASSAKAARNIANLKTGDEGKIWTDASKVACVEIKLTEPMVVLSDFNAG